MPDLESLSYFTISPNLEHMSYVGENQKVVLRGLKNEKEIIIEDMEASKFNWPFTITLSFSKDSGILRALCSDGYKEYDQNNGKLKSHINYENVIGSACSPKEDLVLLYSEKQNPKLFKLENNLFVSEFVGHTQVVVGAAISPDNALVATISWDATTRLWQATTGEELAVLKGQLLSPHAVLFSNDGKRLFVVTGEGTVKVWDVDTRNELFTLQTDEENSACFLDLSENQTLYVMNTYNGAYFRKYFAPDIASQ
jgi:WD40 repeat protein